MKKPFIIFYWGLLISFLGSLPPGMMNIAALQISEKQGHLAAMIYASGSMLAEVFVVCIALAGMNWFIKRLRFFSVLEWMTACLLVTFSAACFIAASSMREFTNIIPEITLPPFITGIFLSIINPLHIPFWLGWSTVLMNKGILRNQRHQWFIAGIGAGTMAGFTVFIYGGQYFLLFFENNSFLLNFIIGIILLITAFLHIRKLIKIPIATRYAQMLQRR
jgi:threonine/homoserine/homoserine lactone efflux protein